MKKPLVSALLLTTIFLSLICPLTILLGSVKIAFAVTQKTIKGDMVIPANNITVLENYDITIEGNIKVEEGGLLILKNTAIKISQSKAYQYCVIIKGRLEASFSSIIPDPKRPRSYNITVIGNGFVQLFNFDMSRSGTTCQLILEDSATVVGDKVNLLEGFIIVKKHSSLKLTNSKIKPSSSKTPLTLYDFSDVSLTKTSVAVSATKPLFEVYGFSRLYFSDTNMANGIIRAYNYSKLSIMDCEGDLSIELYHSSSAIIKGGRFKSLKTYGSSMASITKTMSVKEIAINTYDMSTVFLYSGRVMSAFAYNNSRLTIIGSLIEYGFDMSGGVVGAYGSAEVLLAGSTVRILNAYESSTVSLSNVTIKWMARASSFSSLLFDNCQIETLAVAEASSVKISKSYIASLDITNSPKVDIVNSNIGEATFNFKSANISFASLGPFYCNYWSSTANGTLVTHTSGYGADITLKGTKIQYGLNINLFGSSNASIFDSRLKHLGAYDSATIHLFNSTATSYYLGNETRIFTYWYLTVYALNGTSLNVFYQNGTVAIPTITIVDVVKFPLLEKVVDGGGSIVYTEGNYKFNAEWNGNSIQREIKMSDNVIIYLTPANPSQHDTTTIVTALIIICAVLLGTSLFYLKRRKRFSKNP